MLTTDASIYGLGAVLSQKMKGRESVVRFVSRSVIDTEKAHQSNELECLAVVWSVDKLRYYLHDNARYSGCLIVKSAGANTHR